VSGQDSAASRLLNRAPAGLGVAEQDLPLVSGRGGVRDPAAEGDTEIEVSKALHLGVEVAAEHDQLGDGDQVRLVGVESLGAVDDAREKALWPHVVEAAHQLASVGSR